MDARDVRRLVSSLEGAVEGEHHRHPDFRVGNRIFATLNEAEDRSALRLTRAEARALAAADAATFRLVSDREPVAWVGVLLERASEEQFGDLLEEAWRLRAAELTPSGRRASPARRRPRKSR